MLWESFTLLGACVQIMIMKNKINSILFIINIALSKITYYSDIGICRTEKDHALHLNVEYLIGPCLTGQFVNGHSLDRTYER